MHPRRVAAALILAGLLLAVGSVLAFPHAGERRYTYHVEEVAAADHATAYEDLSPPAREAFRRARNDSYTAYGDPPLATNVSVDHDGTTYRVSATVTEYDHSWTIERGIPFALSTLLGGAGLALVTARE